MQNVEKNKANGRTIAFLTLGCKVNYYETEKMIAQFREAGYQVVSFEDYADIYIVNTCTVTNIADRKSRKMLHRAKKQNPYAIVVATGCYAQAEQDKLNLDEQINLVVGNDEKEQIVMLLEEYQMQLGRVADSSTQQQTACELTHEPEERTRACLKIQQGCNQFCSYCMIPFVRGKLKSTKEAEVVREVKELVCKGYKEVVLTGIHLSSYGVDWDEVENEQVRKDSSYFVHLMGRPLLSLLSQLQKLPGLERIRLGSLEPRIITDSFVKELSKLSKVCPHFHLSLQSGCDTTLERMNRKYTTEEYQKGCDILRSYYDKPALTTDIIVGFPGETEEEFTTTLRFAKEIGFAQIHVFKYSRRRGTRADAMKEQIAETTKNERSERLLALESMLARHYAESFCGEETSVLIEELVKDTEGRQWETGHNERYLRLMIPATNRACARENAFVRTRIVGVQEDLTVLTEECG